MAIGTVNTSAIDENSLSRIGNIYIDDTEPQGKDGLWIDAVGMVDSIKIVDTIVGTTFEENQMVILKGKTYSALIFPINKVKNRTNYSLGTIEFDDIWIYNGGRLNSYTTYYGDGNKWNLLKNGGN